MKDWQILCGVILFQLLLLGSASGEAQSIESFVAAEEKWSRTIGANWQLEGRYALIGDNTLKFANCSLPFLFGPGVERPPGRFTNLEVTGKIERREGKLIFLMDSIRSIPNDTQRLLLEKSKLDPGNSQGYYKLANWAESRAAFYNDSTLGEASQDLIRSGLEIEFRELQPNNTEGLIALVRKARSFRLDPRLVQEFLHEGFWDRFNFLTNKEPASTYGEYAELLVAVSKDLDGARQPLEIFNKQSSETYLAEPSVVYKNASKAERSKLERLFYLEIVTTKILKKVDESGKNGLQISAELKNEAPEREDLIRHYAGLGLKFESARVSVMTRQEVLDLANLFLKHEQPDQAQETKRKWLKSRESLFKENGARGLVDLAEEWIQLLDDRNMAAKFYIAAWKENSQYPLAATWLTENGYALHEGNWIPAELVPMTPETAIERAIREGRIETGMTTHQVKTAMGVAPDSMVRFATQGNVSEMWVYRSAGIIVRFSWKLGRAETIVESISSLGSPKVR